MKLVIFDIDGVILRGSQAVPHASDAVKSILNKGIKPLYLTNNSTLTPEVFVERIGNVGIETSIDAIMTSSMATASYLEERTQDCRNVFVVGEKGIIKALEEKHFQIVNDNPEKHARYVVVGMDRQFNYEKISRAQYEILYNGAILIATNYDPVYPAENSRVKPGGGIMVRAIEACTNQKAIIIGKPEATSIDLLMKKFDASSSETAIVGDNLDTDIAAGKRAGIRTIFVLTGIHIQKDILKRDVKLIPDFIIKDLSSLKDCLMDG